MWLVGSFSTPQKRDGIVRGFVPVPRLALSPLAHKHSRKLAVSCSGEEFLMYSRGVLVLMLSLVTGLLQASQNAPAQGETEDTRSTIGGVWRREKPSIERMIHGDQMEGALRLEDRTVY